ncbi:methionine ABC transporter ATP-binding protein [Candidatus Formimonas warabiya]|uniref:Methionine ABC transporter ATP-binding protein n=1 Tax=Formimonas warabiya TaxID=1761012 RepID=A0A3G1KZR2_FORW1|nr:ATP-binding cassette domain-containing protein [Candidatus Formimonas warabiya]ATW28026.1 methionine ABC transporter ATP-binding protein [Candidatus Formimonas warabiya]
MIKISGLKKVYQSDIGDVTALEDVNLDIRRGEVFGIIGSSGAGKSTLIRCINLLEKPSAGKIEIAGQDITELSGKELILLRRSLGMIFQHFNLLMQQTVADNVAFPLEIARVPRTEIATRVQELLKLVGLSEKAGAYPAQLSGGQKQRVAIARALANNPKVLLCDEATSALDALTTKSILALLKDINEKLGLTIVLITHQIEVVKEICDRVAVIEKNRIVETGRVVDILTKPKTACTKNLVGGDLFEKIPKERILFDGPQDDKRRLKVTFTGEAAMKPLISYMILEFRIYANILFADINYLKEAVVGELVLELTGARDAVDDAVRYLKGQNLIVEELER